MRATFVDLSVVIPTHNPHPGRLARTLNALRCQTLAPDRWESIIVDNVSSPPVSLETPRTDAPDNLRIISEPVLGLTAARRAGFRAAGGEFIVMVDDDNVLAPDYLAHVQDIFARHPHLGAIGGRSVPDFEIPPASWVREFDGLLACRDLGSRELIATQLWDDSHRRNEYPFCAPIGAGMALRRAAVQCWLDHPVSSISDRRGTDLTSGGDNDIVLTLLRQGWHVGYFPQLSLTHLIPAGRLTPDYLTRLNRAIQRSWVQVLDRHAIRPWRAIAPVSLPLRVTRAWLRDKPWTSPAARVRHAGIVGRLEGQADLSP